MHLQVLGRLDQKKRGISFPAFSFKAFLMMWISTFLALPPPIYFNFYAFLRCKHLFHCPSAPKSLNSIYTMLGKLYWWAPSCSIRWTCTGHCYMKIMLPSPKNLHQCTGTALFISDNIPLAKVWSLTYHWKTKPILYSPYKILCHQFYHDPNFQRMYTPALNF